MRLAIPFLAASLLAVLGTPALAAEAEQPSTWMTPSTASRAEVQAGASQALHDGSLPAGEASYAAKPSAAAATSRAQVQAEAREAMRLGLVPARTGMRAATAADLEQIRQAGLRALAIESSFAAK